MSLTSRIVDISVILASLKVRKRGKTTSRVRHDSQPPVYQSLLVHLAESPPNRFHEARVEGLIIVVEIDPSAHSLHGRPPFPRISHDDATALSVVFVDPHTHDVLSTGDLESFVNLVLYR